MKDSANKKPWIELAMLISQGNAEKVEKFLEEMSPSETARTVSRIDEHTRTTLLTMLGPGEAADMLLDLPDEQVADLIEEINPEDAAAIVSKMPGEEQADILADVKEENVQAILNEMPRDQAFQARQLLKYPEDSAGGIMTTEYLAFAEDKTVEDVLQDIRANREVYLDYNIQYLYVIDKEGVLRGVLKTRDLILASSLKPIREIMVDDPLNISVNTPLDELISFFEEHPFLGVPVTGRRSKLLGVVRRGEVMEAEGERDKDSYLKASGIVGGEELRSMPWWERSRRRLSWLSINILLNVVAAGVIAMYQDTLSAVIALAVFLPIISDMSGCSGNQAVAVSIRELTLGLVKPYEIWRVLLKEMSIGIANGIILGILLGGVAFLWKGNIYLGLVVGGALAINTFVAVCLGGLVPLLLKWMKKDPALASGPILTTVTDMCGFFFALYFATIMLPLIS